MTESESPFIDFLVREGEELRRRLLWCLGSLALVACVLIGLPTWEQSFALKITAWLQQQLLPAGVKLAFLDPLEPMLVVMKLSLGLSAGICIPVLTWHLIQFTAPALPAGMRGFYWRFTLLAMLLFAVGLFLSYQYILPMSVKMLISYGEAAGGVPILTFSRFFSFSVMVVLAFSLPFEAPLLMGFMQRFNLVSAGTFRKQRWKAYGVLIILSQFVTPDPLVTPLIFSGMSILLYECGILLGRWL